MNTDNIIFAGIYSPKYENVYKRIEADLKKHIPIKNIQYKKVPQSVFENPKDTCVLCQTFRTPKPPPCTFVFHHGETCKIEHQIELYTKYKDTDKVIVYTDCDIVITDKTFPLLAQCVEDLNAVDMIFQQEYGRPSTRFSSDINIGLTISYSNERIIQLYERVLRHMIRNEHPYVWDQQVVNWMFSDKKTDLTFKTVPNHSLFKHIHAGGSVAKLERRAKEWG
jgi:hypothetical protein